MIKLPFAILLFLFFFTSCKKELVKMDVPWFISLSDAENLNYSIQDTLKKYDAIDENIVRNKAQFYSFKANLRAMVKDRLNAKKNLRKAFILDSVAVCNELIFPIHNYLAKHKPDRITSIPPLLDVDLDYIIDLIGNCDIVVSDDFKINKDDSRLFYWLKYVMTRDQWYRVPQRGEDWRIQNKLDIENQKIINRLFSNKAYPKEQYFKEVLQVLLLHSDNPKWTFKWLSIYFDLHKNDEQTKSFINHFIQRSFVYHDPKIQQLIGDYEMSL